jgi:hypothetical protein
MGEPFSRAARGITLFEKVETWKSEPEDFTREVSRKRRIPPPPRIWSTSVVTAARHALRSPIVVRVEDFGNEVVAVWAEVEAHGSGDTEAEAVSALKELLSSLYEDLVDEDDAALGILPLSWKRALVAVILSGHE